MAPPKRKTDQPDDEAPSMRLTRAATKRAADAATGSDALPVEEVPEKKKAKKGKGVAKQKKEKKEALVQNESKEEKEASENVLEPSNNNNKTIVVEHCKQCSQFKTRANLVKEGLEKAGCGITVILNPEKPRRGCFEIRQEAGKKFITLLDMKRPFKPMKDLDLNKIISDIVDEMSKAS